MKMRLKYVMEDTDRHGNIRLYYRRSGRKVRLRGPAGSPEFLADYKAAAASPVSQKDRVRARRDEMADKPEAANGMVKALRQLFRFALRYDHHDDNPGGEGRILVRQRRRLP